MSLSVTHTFVSAVPDDPVSAAAGEVLPSHWNAAHTVTGSVTASPGGSDTDIQFNNSNVLDGDDDLTWQIGLGLTDSQRAAIGNFANLEKATFGAGTPEAVVFDPLIATLTLNQFFSGDLTFSTEGYFEGLSMYPSFKHTGAGDAYVYMLDGEMAISSESTGDFNSAYGMFNAFVNSGSGDIGFVQMLAGTFSHLGSGTVSDASGVYTYLSNNGPGDIITGQVIWADSPFAPNSFTNLIGLRISDMSGFGTNNSYNILSEGTSFITPADTSGGNLFQGHAAVGNYADVNSAILAAGDPVNEFPIATYEAPLIINEFISKAFAAQELTAGLVVFPTFKNTGANRALAFGSDREATISSESTGDFIQTVADYNFIANYGSGDIDAMYGTFYAPYHAGSGAVDFVICAYAAPAIFNNADVTHLIGFEAILEVDAGSTAADATGFLADTPIGSGTITNVYGIDVKDQSGIGTNNSYNILSEGDDSLNVFKGEVWIGNTTVPPGVGFENTFGGGFQTQTPTIAQFVIDNEIAGDLYGTYYDVTAVYINPRYKNTGTNNPPGVAMGISPAITTDSTGDWDYFVGTSYNVKQSGSGDVGRVIAVGAIAAQSGPGTVAQLACGDFTNYFQSTGDIDESDTLILRAPLSSGYSGTATDVYGLQIEDHSGIGAGNNWNIWSQGVSSVNMFEGIIRLGIATNSSPAEGDLWYDGTHLKFRDSTTTHDIT